MSTTNTIPTLYVTLIHLRQELKDQERIGVADTYLLDVLRESIEVMERTERGLENLFRNTGNFDIFNILHPNHAATS